jgi:hypothetical protein
MASSTQRVAELLTTIEQQLEFAAAVSSPDSPTDILLTQNDSPSIP